MKKVLFATTALMLVAGAAAAEVELSGDGRMGVVYNGDDWNFTSRIRAKFTMSGTTDGGLEFGGSFRVDQQDSVCFATVPGVDTDLDGVADTAVCSDSGANAGNAGSIYISGAFGKIEMGDVVGAAEAAVGDMPEVGLTDLGSNDTVYITGDGAEVGIENPIVLYTYTTGNVSFFASFNDGKVSNGSVDDDQAMSIGVKYATDVFSVGLGYESRDAAAGPTVDHIIVGGSYTFGDTTVSANYGEASDIDFTQWGLGVSSTFGAVGVTAFYRNEDVAGADISYYGLGASYDLGGGATLKGGVADNDATGSNAVADFGVAFTF